MSDDRECPSENCGMCNGNYCAVHFTGPCDCDVLDRHGISLPTMTPQPPPSPLSPEQIAAEIVFHGKFNMAGWRHENPKSAERLKDAVAAALKSKQDEIDKLRTRAEQAEQKATACEDMERQASDYTAGLKVKLEQAERERDEALEGLKPFREYTEMFSEDYRDDDRIARTYSTKNSCIAIITMGHCRRAKEIIDRATQAGHLTYQSSSGSVPATSALPLHQQQEQT